jgi:hypothetical protein
LNNPSWWLELVVKIFFSSANSYNQQSCAVGYVGSYNVLWSSAMYNQTFPPGTYAIGIVGLDPLFGEFLSRINIYPVVLADMASLFRYSGVTVFGNDEWSTAAENEQCVTHSGGINYATL